mmetsp:Transcript_54951/g.125082  ORF Transcript_54951/g.125082 Transcript_54951/m.125082 type:complete len:206 (+) Transcript_54951:1202-1819(+)
MIWRRSDPKHHHFSVFEVAAQGDLTHQQENIRRIDSSSSNNNNASTHRGPLVLLLMLRYARGDESHLARRGLQRLRAALPVIGSAALELELARVGEVLRAEVEHRRHEARSGIHHDDDRHDDGDYLARARPSRSSVLRVDRRLVLPDLDLVAASLSLDNFLRKFLEMMGQREEADKRQQNKTKGSCAFIVKSGTLEEASLERALE